MVSGFTVSWSGKYTLEYDSGEKKKIGFKSSRKKPPIFSTIISINLYNGDTMHQIELLTLQEPYYLSTKHVVRNQNEP